MKQKNGTYREYQVNINKTNDNHHYSNKYKSIKLPYQLTEIMKQGWNRVAFPLQVCIKSGGHHTLKYKNILNFN